MKKIIIVTFLLLIGCGGWPFEMNENLGRVSEEASGGEYFMPKYNSNKNRLFYLLEEESSLNNNFDISIFDKGSYFYCNDSFNISEKKLLIEEEFCCFDISENGDTVVLATGNASQGGKMVMADISSGSIVFDTIETSQSHIVWVKFSNKGDKIYYATIDEPSGYYRINLDGTGEEPVESADSVMPFDLTKDDSIISGVYPAVNPVDNRYVVMVHPAESYGRSSDIKKTDLILIDREEGDTTFLNAMPYEESKLLYPSWMSDGKSVIFSCKAMVMTDPVVYGTEIWILKDIDLDK